MKKIIFLLLLSYLSHSQNSFYVEYNLKIAREEGLFKNNNYLKEMLDKSVSNQQPIVFKLEINDTISKFSKIKNEIDTSDKVINFAVSIANYTGIVFNMNNTFILKQSSLLGNNYFVKYPIINNWKITNETKLIDNYLCYKATNVYKVVNDVKTFNHPVTAWFCPSLPYKHGPNGYGNLPGLILELQVRNSTYGATLISNNRKNDVSVNQIKNIKIITISELEKKLEILNDFEKLKK
jgi:GLPGLI family protein